jgi:photosystem II stability/assembly factor-like uncharacterized protein
MRGHELAARLVAVTAAVLVLAVVTAQPGALAATAPWAQVTDPFASPPSQAGIATFGAAGVAVVGTGGTMAVSTDGGFSWTQSALPSTPVQADAFTSAGNGWAVGAAGTIVATTDGGATWNPQTSNTTADLTGVAFTDANHGWAVGAAGTIVATTDGGVTWGPQTAPDATPLAAVAFSDASHGWAVGAGGVIIATTDGGVTWAPETSNTTADLVAVAFSDANHGRAEGAGSTALATADGGATWTPDATPPTGNVVSLADGPGRIAYALTAGGHVERTLSNGAAPFALSASVTTLKAGHDVRLTVSSPIRAVGTLYLDDQLAGGAWRQLTHWSWRASPAPAAPGMVLDEPLSKTLYRLHFVFAGHTAATSAAVTVGVQPQISLTRTSFSLRKGNTYRLTGRVFPTETGRKVPIWTNRGGTWRQVIGGGLVALVRGTSFASRLFGTPKRESYKLQVRMAASTQYLATTSALVTVTVR